ncbi:Hsp20/alpha crystallin family protein [Pullulanibacillus sp. KACC 23026]|uniref:Hsp20/alpha crystallin family protein n=1 Tax=Pullulanibacillus sp. KACC 23026 TaxID=3028315 RepID=UPI0023B158A8|nr:Hsp20/alpha crystallin family protein [Pullulanibacillus sp. KACC 23026]WEG12403.1 Hsp20/alpha crystallin family protein [Pullulanibacillus sp. KACC 23026]
MAEGKNDWKHTVNQFLGKDFWHDFQDLFSKEWPTYNLYESESSFICQIALPGLKELGDVTVSIDNTKLLIRGNAHYHLSGYSIVSEELLKGSFEREIVFPSPVQTEPVEATYRKGMLIIQLQKLKGQEISEIIIEEED